MTGTLRSRRKTTLRGSIDGDPAITIVVPAHNEAARIGGMLADYVHTFGPEAEFVVVLNGCTDGTRAVVEAVARNDVRMHLVEIPQAVGKGGAVRAGFALARAPVVGYADADGATPAREFRRLAACLGPTDGPGYDAVIASRWHPGAHVRLAQPAVRRVASRVFNLCVRALFGMRYADTQCGAKIFRRAALERALADVETANFAFDVDVLFALHRAGARVREEPTTWSDRPGSRVNVASASPKMLASLVRLRLRHSMIRAVIPLFDRVLPTQPMATKRGLRVLIVNWRDVRHPRAGGAETYLHEIARRLVVRGAEVEWLCAGFRGGAADETIDGVRIRRVGDRATIYLLAAWTYLRRLHDRFDVIVDSENGIPFFTPLFSLKPKVLLVYHVHRRVFLERMPFPINRLFVWLELGLVPAIYRRVPVVTISDDTHADLLRYGKTRLPIAIVHPGVGADCLPGEKATAPTAVYVGRLEPYKRVDLLVDAFARVHAALPAARLRVVGAGTDERRLRAQVAARGLGEVVTFCGFVSDETKVRELAGAWVFASASSHEGWGIAAIEAHACGTPAVAFDVAGLREAILRETTGALVLDGDVAAFAARLFAYLTDAPLRERHARAARERARAFDWDATAERFYELLRVQSLDQPLHLLHEDRAWHVVARVESPALHAEPRSFRT